MLRAAGIVALIVFTACTQNNPPPVASPSPVIPQGNWTQDLTFTGAITGQITAIVPDSGDQVSACTGSKTRTGEQWADTFYGSTDGGESRSPRVLLQGVLPAHGRRKGDKRGR